MSLDEIVFTFSRVLKNTSQEYKTRYLEISFTTPEILHERHLFFFSTCVDLGIITIEFFDYQKRLMTEGLALALAEKE